MNPWDWLVPLLLSMALAPARPLDVDGDVAGAKDPASGNLIAVWKEYDDRTVPVVVREDYAVYMVWLQDVRRFIVYDNTKGTVFSTRRFGEFLTRLSKLPIDISIQRFDTCTVSRTYDMPRKERARLKEVMRDGNRKWAINPVRNSQQWLICYCETKGMRYPGDR